MNDSVKNFIIYHIKAYKYSESEDNFSESRSISQFRLLNQYAKFNSIFIFWQSQLNFNRLYLINSNLKNLKHLGNI
jgi:hypothetical protein